jgi:hypothetical protein
MFNRFTDYYFWFAQPTTILEQADKLLFYVFAGMLVLAIILLIGKKISKNPINKNLLNKLWNLTISTSITGLFWFWVRYENTQIFGRRYWAGLTLVVALIWLGFILKYLVFSFRTQKIEYDKEMVKSKYLPKAR